VLKRSTPLAHVTMLVETAEGSTELAWALALVNGVVARKKHALHFVGYGGLRALVEVAIFHSFAAGEKDAADDMRPEGVVSAVLGPVIAALEAIMQYPAEVAKQLEDDAGCTALLGLLETPVSGKAVVLALQVLSHLADSPAATRILDSGGIYQLSYAWKNTRNTDGEFDAAKHLWTGRALVNLAWRARFSSHQRTTFQSLAMVVEQGGLPAWIENARLNRGADAEGAEFRKRALWAIGSWLSVEHTDAKVKFVMSGGLEPLLEVTEANSTVEDLTCSEIALGKILCAAGHTLRHRIEMLQLEMQASKTDEAREKLWSRIADNFLSQ